MKNINIFIYKVKYAKLLFDYINSVCGIKILEKDNVKNKILERRNNLNR
jgi:hypothetical protein